MYELQMNKHNKPWTIFYNGVDGLTDSQYTIKYIRDYTQRYKQAPTVKQIKDDLFPGDDNRTEIAIGQEVARIFMAKDLRSWKDSLGGLERRRKDLAMFDAKMKKGTNVRIVTGEARAHYSGKSSNPSGKKYTRDAYEFEFESHNEPDYESNLRANLTDAKKLGADIIHKFAKQHWNKFNNKLWSKKTIQRYLNGGQGYENGPKSIAFKKFLQWLFRDPIQSQLTF